MALYVGSMETFRQASVSLEFIEQAPLIVLHLRYEVLHVPLFSLLDSHT